MKKTIFVLALLSFLLSASVFSGDEKSNVRGLGMAGATTVSSRTIDAIGINPALLAYMGISGEVEFKGKVIDAETKQPIPGALVTIVEKNVKVRANLGGEFSIKGLSGGNYTILVSQKGYETVRIKNMRAEGGSTIRGIIPISRGDEKKEKVLNFSELGFDVARSVPVIYNDPSGFTMSLVPQIGFGVGMKFLNYQLYLDYFTGVDSAGKKVGKHLTDDDKRKILDSFAENPGTLMTQIDVKLVNFAFHIGKIGVGLGVRERGVAKFVIPKEFLEFLLFGNPPDSVYSYNLKLGGAWTREYSVSLGGNLPINLIAVKNINIGFGVKMIHGFGYIGTDDLNLTIETADSSRGYEITAKLSGLVKRAGVDLLDPDKENKKFNPFPVPAGKGLGFDIGVSAEVLGLFVVGASVTDVGSINWAHNAIIASGDTSWKFTGYTSQEKLDSLKESFENYLNRKRYESFTTGLPTALRFGVATDVKKFIPFFPGGMLVAVDYYQPLGNEQIMFKKPRFALGVEWRLLDFLPLRAGVSVGGIEGFALSAGTGLNLSILELNIATGHLNEVLSGNNMRHFSVATELRLKF